MIKTAAPLQKENMTETTPPRRQHARRRFVLTTFGSFGDLHPYIALALELRARGHQVVLATHEIYRPIIEAEGIDFHTVRPDVLDFGEEAEFMKRVMDLRTGPKYLICELAMPYLRASYADLSAACEGADMFVTHPLAIAAPLIAEQRRAQGMAWASVAIAPLSFMSAYDPSILAPAPWLRHLHGLGPGFYRMLLQMMKRTTDPWVKPWHQFRKELGLPPTTANPVLDGQFSPDLTLALFSPLLAAPQPDWPPHTVVTGFPFYDRHGAEDRLDPALDAFLNAGEPPIVFTLGSAAVMAAGDFYAQSVAAAQKLGRRALLLVGRDPANRPAQLPPGIAAFDYAPYSQVFPRAAAIVHQGGIGTTAQALRAGRPALIVPFAFDQPDNAMRVVRMGVGRTLARRLYTADRVAEELRALLEDNRYANQAAAIGPQIQAEEGASRASDAMEALLDSAPKVTVG